MSSYKNWCFTLNNYTSDDVDTFKCMEYTYLVFGYEVGDSGTPHLQGFIVFPTNKRLSAMKKLHATAHWEKANGSAEQNFKYCTKQGNFIELGKRPVSAAEKGLKEQHRWSKIKELAKANKLDEIDPKTYVLHYTTLKKIAKDNMTKPEDLEDVCGFWLYGPAGTGKTTYARSEFPGAFIKSRDRWWDGYQGQEVVILDDLDKYNVALGGYLKDWADKWSFKAESKGSVEWLRPKKFIVTSQYSIDEIFEDKETREALHRRYKCKHFLIKYT